MSLDYAAEFQKTYDFARKITRNIYKPKLLEGCRPFTPEELEAEQQRIMLLKNVMFFQGKDLPEYEHDIFGAAERAKQLASELWHWGFYIATPATNKLLRLSDVPFYSRVQAEEDWRRQVHEKAVALEQQVLYREASLAQSKAPA